MDWENTTLDVHPCKIDVFDRAKIVSSEGHYWLYTYTDLGRSMYYDVNYCPICGECFDKKNTTTVKTDV